MQTADLTQPRYPILHCFDILVMITEDRKEERGNPFYYGALGSNPVNAVGFGLHEASGADFFENARRTILESWDSEAARVYAYGVLCHFALDVTCHPYVEEKIRRSGISHTEIEVEFDRKLMLLDGHRTRRAHLR